ncbi:Clp protease N-terminal domain-containing protein [Nocardia sp. XZ_19_385]|uniref:Clp protease N-terminal domain-containing protein n=1 Tax=Nocardia sp. XZ_19_385 TaxID=2769488 RepID=UPI00188EFB29|nr:Clp protease N-terminal domain-containing protein [Nocardia sp. XZ_19_385]
MFEKFTDRARRVVVLAQEEARALNHHFIGAEHLLVAVLREAESEENSPTAKALHLHGYTPSAAVERVGLQPDTGSEAAPEFLPFTDGAKEALQASLRESIALGHTAITPDHVLLGIIRSESAHVDSPAAAAITTLGLTAEDLRHPVGPSRLQLAPLVRTAFLHANDEAVRAGSEVVGAEHLLLGLLDADPELAKRVFGALGVDTDEVTAKVRGIVTGTD